MDEEVAALHAEWDLAMRVAKEVVDGDLPWAQLDAGPAFPRRDSEDRFSWLVNYQINRLRETARRRSGPNRRAYRVLDSLLTSSQSAMLRRNGDFLARGSHGGVYRLQPRYSNVWRVELYGSRYFIIAHACLHEHGERVMPPADVTIGHLLWLRADEPSFIEAANWSPCGAGLLMWNGDWQRRLRQAEADRAMMRQFHGRTEEQEDELARELWEEIGP
jgi:hypothetical protein